MRRALALLALAAPIAAAGQPRTTNVEALVASVETSAPAYGYGETIEVRFTLRNPTDSLATLVGSSSCQAQFVLDGFRSAEHTVCTADEIEVPVFPRASRTWTWRLDPRDLGLPAQPGLHTLTASYGKTATATFEAPVYLGGIISFSTVAGVSSGDLAPLRDSLGAEVLSEFPDPPAGISGRWRIAGTSLGSVVSRISADTRFRFVEPVQVVQYASIVTAAEEAAPAAARLGRAYPNPASAVVTLDVGTDRPVDVEVLDRLGRRVLLARAAGPRVQLDVKALPAGVYVARAVGRAESARFTVVR